MLKLLGKLWTVTGGAIVTLIRVPITPLTALVRSRDAILDTGYVQVANLNGIELDPLTTHFDSRAAILATVPHELTARATETLDTFEVRFVRAYRVHCVWLAFWISLLPVTIAIWLVWREFGERRFENFMATLLFFGFATLWAYYILLVVSLIIQKVLEQPFHYILNTIIWKSGTASNTLFLAGFSLTGVEREQNAQADGSPPPAKAKTIIAWAWGNKWWLLILAWVGTACVAALVANRVEHDNLASAHAQWDSGQKADAVSYYKTVIGTSTEQRFKADLPKIYQRVIEFELDRNNIDYATKLVRTAKQKNIAIRAPGGGALQNP